MEKLVTHNEQTIPTNALFSYDIVDDRYAWIFEDPKPLPSPIPMKGALRLWTTDIQCLHQGAEA